MLSKSVGRSGWQGIGRLCLSCDGFGAVVFPSSGGIGGFRLSPSRSMPFLLLLLILFSPRTRDPSPSRNPPGCSTVEACRERSSHSFRREVAGIALELEGRFHATRLHTRNVCFYDLANRMTAERLTSWCDFAKGCRGLFTPSLRLTPCVCRRVVWNGSEMAR